MKRGARWFALAVLASLVPTSNCFQHRSVAYSRRRVDNMRLNIELSQALEVVVGVGGLAWAASWVGGSEARARRAERAELDARAEQRRQARWARAYIAPKPTWSLDELSTHDGSRDPEGPLLLACDGVVYNVHKGRHFYGPGCDYHVFAGRDATRLLARSLVEEEDPASAAKPLTLGERAVLAGWVFILRAKYEAVGRLEGWDGVSLADGIDAAPPTYL